MLCPIFLEFVDKKFINNPSSNYLFSETNMISKIYAEVLEELKKLGGVLSQEQEIALKEVYQEDIKVRLNGRREKIGYC